MAQRRGRAWVALLATAGLAGGGCMRSQEAISQSDVLRTDPLTEVLSDESPSELAYLSGNIMSTVTSAVDALEKEQVTDAQGLLEAAVRDMELLYTRLPGEPFIGEMDTALARLEAGEVADLKPLLARARERREVLGTETLELLEEAAERREAGDLLGAAENLRAARELVAEDLLLLPLDEARARLLAARNALRAGDDERALGLLTGVTDLLGNVRAMEPLVLVRWQLRAAATEAELGNWDRARELLAIVVRRLENYRGGPNEPLTGTVEIMEAETRILLAQTRGQDKPTPKEIRRLANRALPVPTG
ncbi:MAG TPA: hypothetical protein VLQ93_10475 [Myxococcaceae bacterium]|nr:hypothetical protein [Myxococcaceae bacterium]